MKLRIIHSKSQIQPVLPDGLGVSVQEQTQVLDAETGKPVGLDITGIQLAVDVDDQIWRGTIEIIDPLLDIMVDCEVRERRTTLNERVNDVMDEMNARWFAALDAGKVTLPDEPKLKALIQYLRDRIVGPVQSKANHPNG